MKRNVDIKICGLTNIEDARAALDAGADFLGFVLYRRSPRSVTAKELRRIVDQLPPNARAIGVFVNESRENIAQVASDCGLYAVQLQGDEPAKDILPLPVRVWRAVRLERGASVPAPKDWPADRYVLDASVPGVYGGTGQKTDWAWAAGLARAHAIMLAGGLTPENVADAIRQVNPTGVDVASGVEKAPGKKDHRKLEAFIRAARRMEDPEREAPRGPDSLLDYKQ